MSVKICFIRVIRVPTINFFLKNLIDSLLEAHYLCDRELFFLIKKLVRGFVHGPLEILLVFQ